MHDPRVIWLVDDSAIEAERAKRFLGAEYAVETFPESAPMLERIARGERPSLLILDVELPNMSGLDTCRFLRARQDASELPILMVTIRSGTEALVEGLEAGANDYLAKPFDDRVLKARVDSLVRVQRLQRQALEAEAARSRALSQAEQDRERLRNVFMHAPTGVCVLLGEQHVCAFVNPEYQALLGGRDVLGKPLREALPEFGELGFFELLDRVFSTGETFVAQAARVPEKISPSERYVKITFQPSRSLEGEVAGVEIFTFDVTEQVLGRRKLEELLSLASHELKTPLTSFQLELQLLERELGRNPQGVEPARLRRSLTLLARQVRRQTRLVDELLESSRFSTDRMPLDAEDLEVSSLVSEVAARFEEDSRVAGSPITVVAPGAVNATLDRLRTDQVVTNLLSNALKYGRGKPIEVSVEAAGMRRLRLSVRDHGIGIGPQDLSRVFDRFERAVSDRHYGGFGLGLWITRRILDSMGGTISVESELGRGSTFTVELPRSLVGLPEAPP